MSFDDGFGSLISSGKKQLFGQKNGAESSDDEDPFASADDGWDPFGDDKQTKKRSSKKKSTNVKTSRIGRQDVDWFSEYSEDNSEHVGDADFVAGSDKKKKKGSSRNSRGDEKKGSADRKKSCYLKSPKSPKDRHHSSKSEEKRKELKSRLSSDEDSRESGGRRRDRSRSVSRRSRNVVPKGSLLGKKDDEEEPDDITLEKPRGRGSVLSRSPKSKDRDRSRSVSMSRRGRRASAFPSVGAADPLSLHRTCSSDRGRSATQTHTSRDRSASMRRKKGFPEASTSDPLSMKSRSVSHSSEDADDDMSFMSSDSQMSASRRGPRGRRRTMAHSHSESDESLDSLLGGDASARKKLLDQTRSGPVRALSVRQKGGIQNLYSRSDDDDELSESERGTSTRKNKDSGTLDDLLQGMDGVAFNVTTESQSVSEGVRPPARMRRMSVNNVTGDLSSFSTRPSMTTEGPSESTRRLRESGDWSGAMDDILRNRRKTRGQS